MNHTLLALALMGGLSLACAASAQSVTSLADLQVVESRQKISVEGADGKVVAGRFSAISGDELQLEIGGPFSRRKEAFAAGSIAFARIRVPETGNRSRCRSTKTCRAPNLDANCSP